MEKYCKIPVNPVRKKQEKKYREGECGKVKGLGQQGELEDLHCSTEKQGVEKELNRDYFSARTIGVKLQIRGL
jgi:hypothetical protein